MSLQLLMMLPTPKTTAMMMMQPQLLLLELIGGTFYRVSVPVKGVLIFYNKITIRRVRMAAHA